MKFLKYFGMTAMCAVFISNHVFSQIYFEELSDKTYSGLTGGPNSEIKVFAFMEYTGDGTIRGELSYEKLVDPSNNYYEPISAVMFTATQSDNCGNCLILKIDEGETEYYFMDHEYGNFWLQQTDAKFDKWDESKRYQREGNEPVGGGEYLNEENNEIVAQVFTDEKYYDWGEEPEDGGWVYFEPYGYGFEGVSVSSTLPEDENYTYVMENAFDNDPTTTWFSNPAENEEYPKGESIRFYGDIQMESIWILNGMQESEENFENNSRIKTMDVYVNGEYFATVTLHDQMGAQKIELTGIEELRGGEGGFSIQFIITDYYPGNEYTEIGITEIFTMGEGD